MKLIHAADIHLGSPLSAALFLEKRTERQNELIFTFNRMIEYAKQNGVDAVLLSGDVFDSNAPFKKHKEFFYSAIKNSPEITFFYLRGNHDTGACYTEDIENLITFDESFKSFDFKGVTISGCEITDANALSFYSSIDLKKEDTNIVMLHGALSSSVGKDKIVLSKLYDRNIDYLALGHIHSFETGSLDLRGVYAYSGCLEPRGFDECGSKGFVLLDIQNGKIQSEFVPFSKRTIHEITVDISGTSDSYSAFKRVRESVLCPVKDLVRVILEGEVSFDASFLERDLKDFLNMDFYLSSVKNKTTTKINLDDFKDSLSLKGEFVRSVSENNALSENEKNKIISLGLKALMGEEV